MTVAIVLTNYDSAIDIIRNEHTKNRIYELRIDCDDKLFSLVENKLILPENTILTVRSKSEGGQIENDINRDELINQVLTMKVGYLDLELNSDIDLIKQIVSHPDQLNSSMLIISQHNYIQNVMLGYNEFYTTFSKILKNNVEMQNRIILKYVGNPSDSYETLVLMSLMNQYPKQILLGIGHNGDVSRTFHSTNGQEFVFGGLLDNNIIHYKILDELTKPNPLMLGLVGGNLSYSLSPIIHNILMKSTKIKGYYHLLEASSSNRANNMVRKLVEYGITGFNITIPFKKSVIDIVDHVNDEAESVQAVNTLKLSNGKLYGYNTDITGFSSFLRNNNLHKLDGAIILGAGGASRAVCQSLIKEGISVSVVSRSKKRFDEFPKDLKSQINFKLQSEISNQMKSELYINTTPLGLKGENPLDFVELPTNTQAVVDLLYHEIDSAFVQKIKNKGIEAYDGKEMLFNQAVDSFQIWTNKDVKHEDLYRQFLKEIQVK